MEVSVRSARLTDVDAAVRLIAREVSDRRAERDEADRLRHLLFIPAATVVVAIAERRLIGVGVLSIRPSIRSGPFVGVVDELGLEVAEVSTSDRGGGRGSCSRSQAIRRGRRAAPG